MLKKSTQDPVSSYFQRPALPYGWQVDRGYDRPYTRERFQMLLPAAACAKELNGAALPRGTTHCCQGPSPAMGAGDSKAWQASACKGVMADEGNL